jgi:succinyl-diaminopimelate desuccinylase
MRDFGLNIQIQEVEKDRPNVIGSLKGKRSGPTLLIEGHTDTVGLGDKKKWTVDPFGGNLEGNRLYGRGSMDMKGGLGAAVIAAKALVEAGVQLKGRLMLAGFVDEEGLMKGVKHFVKSGMAKGIDAAITVEPTFRMGIGTCFAGRTRANITTFGVPTHSGINPRSGLGVNAIHKMGKLVQAIAKEPPRHKEHHLYKNSHWQVVTIEGGYPGEATVPDSCTITVDGRNVPGHGVDDVWKYMDEIIENLKKEDKDFRANIEILEEYSAPSWETPIDAPIVQALHQSYQKALGNAPPLNVAPEVPPGSGYALKVATDLHFLAPEGISCVCTGPGGLGAHAENEFVFTDHVMGIAKVLALTIIQFLGVDYG